MRHVFVYAVMLFLFVFAGFGQSRHSPEITGTVEKLIRDEKDGWITFEIELNFRLQNLLVERLFLQKDNFSLQGVEVFKSSTKGSNLQSLFRNQHPPSFSGDSKWIRIGETVMASGSKSVHLTSIDPGESLHFTKRYILGFPTERNANYSQSASWNEVKELSQLYVKFDVNLWENEIRTEKTSSKEFPIRLRERMKEQGVLWFEKIVSEPVCIDLHSATIKGKSGLRLE